jgi:hypothetical protein
VPDAPLPEALTPIETFIAPDRAALVRLAAGSIFSLYLAAWTLDWSGGPWPAHALALDLALGVVVIVGAWRARARYALAPLGATYLHALFQAGLVPAPRSLVEWGGAAVALGFAILVGSLAASYRLRRVMSDP